MKNIRNDLTPVIKEKFLISVEIPVNKYFFNVKIIKPKFTVVVNDYVLSYELKY
jgi:hypothetical protein